MLMEPMTQKFTKDFEAFNDAVDSLIEKAKKELAGERLPVEAALFRLELDMLYGGQVHRKRASSPLLHITSEADARCLYEAFEREFSETFSPLVVHPEGGVYVENFVVTASIPTDKPAIATYRGNGSGPEAALKGSRKCYWGGMTGFEDTRVYDYTQLAPGHLIEGPALLETEYTTVVVPPAFQCSIDEHLFGHIVRV
jgi:N-methylhydantoinase A/acetophenone carboxylase